jgi:hypothetical protein
LTVTELGIQYFGSSSPRKRGSMLIQEAMDSRSVTKASGNDELKESGITHISAA